MSFGLPDGWVEELSGCFRHGAASGPRELSRLRRFLRSGETTWGSGTGGFSASFGSTWHYTCAHAVTTAIISVSAEKAPHNRPSTLLYATAYFEQGTPVSHHSSTPGASTVKETSYNPGKGRDLDLLEFRVTEELLSRMMENIAKL